MCTAKCISVQFLDFFYPTTTRSVACKIGFPSFPDNIAVVFHFAQHPRKSTRPPDLIDFFLEKSAARERQNNNNNIYREYDLLLVEHYLLYTLILSDHSFTPTD